MTQGELTATHNIVPDQLLVATQCYLPVVKQIVELEIGIGRTEHSQPLTLSRLVLARTPNTSAELLDPEGALALDVLLTKLRCAFARRYQGWVPSIGKNRSVFDNILSGGSMSYGGDGPPMPLQRRHWRQTAKWAQRPGLPGKGVRVGLVDTKLYPAPPLAGGWYATTSDIIVNEPASPREGHATFVAGTILREAPGATLEARAVLDGNGSADSWDAAHAIVRQGRSGVDILNLSFSCITGDGRPPLALSTAVDLVSPDVIVVAAAGNHGRASAGRQQTIDGKKIDDISKCVTFPAALDNVIAVGSVAANGERAPYSPEGDWVDVQAHGDNVVSTFPNSKPFNGFARWSGTSFAAGQVSGAIAAQTVPGRVSAREAWAEIYETAIKTSGGTWPPVLAPRFFWQVRPS